MPKADAPNIIVNVPEAQVIVENKIELPHETNVTRKVNRDNMGRIESVTENKRFGK